MYDVGEAEEVQRKDSWIECGKIWLVQNTDEGDYENERTLLIKDEDQTPDFY